MYATAQGTTRFADRFAAYRHAGFYRTATDLTVSSLGIGTYLGEADDATDQAYTDALIAAGENGINFFDCAINYRNQRSERAMGAALKRLQRDEIVVCTKAGFVTRGAMPAALPPGDIVGGMHSMSPEFLADQMGRSLVNLGLDTIDVFYLHNPETQLGFVRPDDFEERIRRAFAFLERMADEGKIRYYGVATWEGLRKKGALDLERLVSIAATEGGAQHRFRFVQLPFNLGMVEAFAGEPESILETASRLGMTVVASASLLQGGVLADLPGELANFLPGLESNAQRAIQFTRSTPGIAVALAGMSRREHVIENAGVARVPPLTPEQYLRIYRS